MYKTAITYVRDHLDEIKLVVARRLQARNVPPYADMDLWLVVERIKRSIELDIDYLETGDPTQWRDYHGEIITQLAKAGHSLDSLIEIGTIVAEVMENFVKTNVASTLSLKDPKTDKTLNELMRRIHNLTALGISFTTTTGLRQILSQARLSD